MLAGLLRSSMRRFAASVALSRELLTAGAIVIRILAYEAEEFEEWRK